MAAKTKAKTESGLGKKSYWAGAIILIALLWWQVVRIPSKYQVNQILALAGVTDTFRIVGIWKVNGVPSYIMESASIVGTTAYAIADVDNNPSWTLV